jgi:hypothetical protein
VVPNIAKTKSKKNEIEKSEQSGGGSLVRASDGLGVTQNQRRCCDDEAQHEDDSPGPAVPGKMARTNAPHELQWHEDDEKRCGNDVEEQKNRVPGESCVHRGGRCEPGMLRRRNKNIEALRYGGESDGDEDERHRPNRARRSLDWRCESRGAGLHTAINFAISFGGKLSKWRSKPPRATTDSFKLKSLYTGTIIMCNNSEK